MSFYKVYEKYHDFDFNTFFNRLKDHDAKRAVNSEDPRAEELLAMLSPISERYIEEMAEKASRITVKNFGKTIMLYTPLYLSNYCVNECIYCGFNRNVNVKRKKLALTEVDEEAKAISRTGLKHVLILTGESRKETPVSYIKDCVSILKRYFSSISVEIYPLSQEEYADLIKTGVDGLTIYQEAYDEKSYETYHPKGPKKNYRNRLDTPERSAKAGMRTVNIGALLGLSDWRKEAFFLGMHAKYLQDKYPDAEISISIPRIRPQVKNFKPKYIVKDKDIVQIITALRIFMPRLGITVSTRESQKLRDNLLQLGVTKMSAGSSTIVGGHTICNDEPGQFEISDKRSVEEMRKLLISKGFQPVLKDWMAGI